MSEITFKEVEATKLNLQLGDVLTVTVKDEDIGQEGLWSLQKKLASIFPNNEVLIFGMGSNSELKFTVTSKLEAVSCGTQSYCSDCNCGKKEQAENK